jgi:hypothetical protein
VTLVLYTRRRCHLCEEMKAVVQAVAADVPIVLEEIDIDGARELKRRYGLDIPVLVADGVEVARHRVTADALRLALRAQAAGPYST